MDRSNLKSVIHIVAGAYVVYLGIRLIRGMSNGEMNGTWYYYLVAGIFIAAGAFIAISGVRRLIKNGAIYWDAPEAAPEDEEGSDYIESEDTESETDEEPVSGGGSFLNAYKDDAEKSSMPEDEGDAE